MAKDMTTASKHIKMEDGEYAAQQADVKAAMILMKNQATAVYYLHRPALLSAQVEKQNQIQERKLCSLLDSGIHAMEALV